MIHWNPGTAAASAVQAHRVVDPWEASWRTLCVTGFPADTVPRELRFIFGIYGGVVHLSMGDLEGVSGAQWALVTLDTPEAADASLSALHGIYRFRGTTDEPVGVCYASTRLTGPTARDFEDHLDEVVTLAEASVSAAPIPSRSLTPSSELCRLGECGRFEVTALTADGAEVIFECRGTEHIVFWRYDPPPPASSPKGSCA